MSDRLRQLLPIKMGRMAAGPPIQKKKDGLTQPPVKLAGPTRRTGKKVKRKLNLSPERRAHSYLIQRPKVKVGVEERLEQTRRVIDQIREKVDDFCQEHCIVEPAT
jgi:hypothetical protein